MLHFSKSEDYATVLIDYLVRHYKERHVSLSEIAKANQFSLLFLRNIAFQLKKAGIIEAVEGKNGGYSLARNPKEIKIGDILQALSSKPLFSCCKDTPDGKCHQSSCSHTFSLRRIHNTFVEKMADLTVLEVVNNKT